jgi:DNA-binding FrmR family transcriptional regulator
MNVKKQKTIIGFKKAKSSLEKIIAMVESDQYCIDIMQQNLAVIGLLRSAHQQLMEGHLDTCFRSAVGASDNRKKQQMTDEILRVSKLFNK